MFAVGWDARLRVPRWVAERITWETSRGDGDRSMHVFREDDGSGSGSGGGRSRRRGGGRNNGGNGNGAATAVSVPAGNGDPDDLGLDPRWRSTNEHYLASGYDRGHCAPAADFKVKKEYKREKARRRTTTTTTPKRRRKNSLQKLEKKT